MCIRDRSWRVACTSGSLAGLRAATVAGLGFTAHSARLIPPGLAEVEPREALPTLGTIEFVVIGGQSHQEAARALAGSILSSAGRILPEAPARRGRKAYSIGPKSGIHFSEKSDAITNG